MPDQTQPGYFRLGSVVLQIPPTDITTHKTVNDDQVATLRSGTPMFVKSGQARWDVTVRWKSIRHIDSTGKYDYSQWTDVRRVVATFRASPFVDVENDFLRQHFTNIQQAYKTQRMAFALKQLSVTTSPDSSNVLDVVLTMTLFNFAPYSIDFAYVGDQNTPVDALDSAQYNFFIDHWITTNMDNSPHQLGEPELTPWDQQEEGSLTFKWRKYLYIPFNTPPPGATSTATAGYAPTVPAPKVPKNISALKLSSDVQTIVNNAAAKFGVDSAVATAQCLYESGGKANAVSRTGAIGLFQLLPSTARGLGISDPYDPVQNAEGGCRYLAQQLQRFGNYSHALGAYNAGAGYILAYRDGRAIQSGNFTINPLKIKTSDGLPPSGTPNGENVPKYVQTILTNAGKPADITTVPPKGTVKAPVTPTSTQSLDTPNQAILGLVNQAVTELPDGTWLLDHYTERGAYFYEEEEIHLANADAVVPSDYDMLPVQVSVVLVNNLPLIPLAGMQYPTYQHVGPTDTMISISMSSVGNEDASILSEPIHEGVQAIVAMHSQLEDQFQNLRTNFRAISSVHRMQAVYIENQLLNLLGIRGTLIRGLDTETVPDSVNLVQCSVLASQYENVFEDTPPFRINGVAGAYKPTLQNILKTGALDKASVEEQNAYAAVKQFGDAWQKHDEAYLLSQILSITSSPIDFLGDVTTPTVTLLESQRTDLLLALDLRGTPTAASATGSTGLGSSLHLSAISLAPFQRDKWPGLQKRRQTLQSASTPFTYSDYFIFTQLPNVLDQNVISNLRTTTEAKFANQKSAIIETMYQKLFDYELLTDPLFSRQTTAIAQSPAFKDQFNSAITVDGPALQPENAGHFCYKDLGLADYRQNPADYLFNYNEQLGQNIGDELNGIMSQTTSAAAAINNNLTAQSQAAAARGDSARAKQLNSFGSSFVFSGDTAQQLPGDSQALMRMLNIPAYSMNSAFPTFKLMLIEEDNSGPFFAFDNFYSYASVIDIEVIKYPDKPDTAIIQLTNLAHALQHRLYDDTAAGKLELEDDKTNVDIDGDVIVGGPNVRPNETGAGGGVQNSALLASKTAAGRPYLRKNFTEGRGETYGRIPLKFFALQTGSKIQVRMGFSNNPDGLWPVFTGQVTEIEGDDILTLTCQSFQLELMTVPGATVIKNSRFGFNFLSGGAAMGGWSLSNAGDTGSVLEKMLTSESARHFGRFQIGGQVDPMLKGFTWTDLGGKLLSNSSNATIQKLGALLQTGYDRSKENILINSTINYDAKKSPDDPANAGRRLFDENTTWLQSYFKIGTPSYSIPKQSELSVWDIIKDVSRRYPHYNLLVKDYGFPYGADATLVYAHPLDWYYYRPPLYGDAEMEAPSNVNQGQDFQNWWTTVGKATWDAIWAHAFDDYSIAGIGIRESLSLAQQSMTAVAGSGPEGFVSSIQQIHGILSGTTVTPPANDALNKFFNGLQTVQNILTKIATSGNLTQGFYQNLDNNFQALLREWESHLVQVSPAANSNRIRPVRKYHLIDHNHIVHNDIIVNDKIYNAVKISDESPLKFNQNIPGQHTRVLNVTELINDPDQNCKSSDMRRVYAQSFLREEVGKMYRGELVLRGVPEIEPMDVILLQDPSTGMVGPVEVDTVIHSFNMENGYITIVKPRLMVIANESVSMNMTRALGFAWANASAELNGLGDVFNPFSPDATTSGTIIAAGVIAGIALTAWALPVGILVASLGLLAGYGIITWVEAQQNLNFFKLQPLSRFGRPWVGGLQGFVLSDFSYSVLQGLRHFDAEEISPTIESWNEFLNYRVDYLQGA